MDKLCEYIDNELSEIERKAASGRVSNSDIERADMLAHLKKSILTNEAMEESYSGEYRDGTMRSYRGNSYARGGRRSYAPRRDSMGRYSRDDAVDEMVEELEDMMNKAPDAETKKELRKFITKMQTM